MTIKLWDWEKGWQCSQVFEGHSHYVMMIVLNPKDNNQFASASLDKTIKVWQLGSPHPNFTLEGHQKGINCIDYFQGGDKPYLISGADDKLELPLHACIYSLKLCYNISTVYQVYFNFRKKKKVFVNLFFAE